MENEFTFDKDGNIVWACNVTNSDAVGNLPSPFQYLADELENIKRISNGTPDPNSAPWMGKNENIVCSLNIIKNKIESILELYKTAYNG